MLQAIIQARKVLHSKREETSFSSSLGICLMTFISPALGLAKLSTDFQGKLSFCYFEAL